MAIPHQAGVQALPALPNCRFLHALLDYLNKIIDSDGVRRQEIWLNRNIRHAHNAQFSIAHGLAVGAYRVPPGMAWMGPALIFSPSIWV